MPVTGEAVALDLRLAQFPSRTLALALDLLIQGACLLLLFFLGATLLQGADAAAVTAISLVGVVAIIVGLPTAIETLARGRSVGKIAAGLRVVRDDGGPVRFRHAFVRALFMIIDFWLLTGAVGLITALLSSRGTRLGDHFAGTVVIRERVPAAASVRLQTYAMPPVLEPWAATLDLSRLPDVTAGQARQFLTRAASLDPGVRATMGLGLAAEISAYVVPPPPTGTPPETYLMAVLTERMRRAARSGPARSPSAAAPSPGAAARRRAAGVASPTTAPAPAAPLPPPPALPAPGLDAAPAAPPRAPAPAPAAPGQAASPGPATPGPFAPPA
ncbi:MAG: RDD family protein [Frankiales bacterium]|nr:RDD family protein [Frankiales bacterium]